MFNYSGPALAALFFTQSRKRMEYLPAVGRQFRARCVKFKNNPTDSDRHLIDRG